jgi:Lysyl oxidase
VKKAVALFASMALALLVSSGIVALLWGAGAHAEPTPPLYPDLETLEPYKLRFGTEIIDGETHQLLRFSIIVWNAGDGPLELLGKTVSTPSGGERTKVYQRLYSSSGRRTTTGAIGTYIFHPEHNHFHFGDFAEYQLWTRSEYRAWLQSSRTEGSPERADRLGTKVSFCISDFEVVDLTPISPRAPVYKRCDPHIQGISVGWGDTYDWYLYDQWVDLGTTPLADGRYVLRSIADPDNLIYESEGKSDDARESRPANAAVTYFAVEGGILSR